MEAILNVAQWAVPFALRIAKYFMEEKAKEGGITPSEASAIALFNAVVAFIESQTQAKG